MLASKVSARARTQKLAPPLWEREGVREALLGASQTGALALDELMTLRKHKCVCAYVCTRACVALDELMTLRMHERVRTRVPRTPHPSATHIHERAHTHAHLAHVRTRREKYIEVMRERRTAHAKAQLSKKARARPHARASCAGTCASCVRRIRHSACHCKPGVSSPLMCFCKCCEANE